MTCIQLKQVKQLSFYWTGSSSSIYKVNVFKISEEPICTTDIKRAESHLKKTHPMTGFNLGTPSVKKADGARLHHNVFIFLLYHKLRKLRSTKNIIVTEINSA